MKVLICGDIVGRSGRQAIERELPFLKKNKKLDFVVANGENAANGFGITKKICEQLFSLGVDAITSGNHIWDQKEIIEYIETDQRLIRPCNFPEGTPGKGYASFKMQNGENIVVINIMCRLFMDLIDDPFKCITELLDLINSKINQAIILVDIHGESTSEKMAIAHFLDGKVSGVFGTHTHIPTSDLHILEKGTFYQTDLGMCGDYNSVIGMKKELSIKKFTQKHMKTRLEPATGEGTLCGTILSLDGKKVKGFEQIILGGKLQEDKNGRSL
ncbi:MAG: TIGR00282 family metallophosphoesterase [Pseudomonadota bacterium]|nr:TIGR00282 family metallophosphoesterase [Pseudomonadota bacterium]